MPGERRGWLSGSWGSIPEDQLKPAGSSRIADIARSPWFEQLALLLIALNAVYIAVEADAHDADNVRLPVGYRIVGNLFCLCFSIEWFIRFWAYRQKKAVLMDMWFIIDTVLLALMIVETWLIGFVMLFTRQDYGDQLSVLVVLRLIRVLRLARISRLTQVVPEMRYMIRGMISATRTVVTTLVLVIIVVYVFAVVFVQLTKDSEIGVKHFDGVWHAMCMLTVQAIAPDHGDLLNELSSEGWYFGAMFFIYLILTTLTMLNMLIGILCEVSSRVADSEKETMDIELVRWKLEQIMEEGFDPDHDGRISKAEFFDIVRDKHAIHALEQLGVQTKDLMAHADDLYDICDQNGEHTERTVSVDEFMQEVLKLRGNNAATIRDITNLRKYVKDAILELKDWLEGGSSRRAKSFIGPPVLGIMGVTTRSEESSSRWRKKCQSTQEQYDGLPSEVLEMKRRISGIEEALTEVVQGQLQVQATLQQRLPVLASEAAKATSGGMFHAGKQRALEEETASTAGDHRRTKHSIWATRKVRNSAKHGAPHGNQVSPEVVESIKLAVNEDGATKHFFANVTADDSAGTALPGKPDPEAADPSKVLSGTMDRNKRRYGFILQDNNQEHVFVLPSHCEAFGCVLPPAGTRLIYTVRADPKSGKKRAEEVQPEPARVQPEPARVDDSSSSLPFVGA